MGAQDDTEKVLRSLHVMLSKSEAYEEDSSKVIVEKQKMIELLGQLNKCIYALMEEYEMTQNSRDKAEREFHKRGDEIIWDASRKAEDIYAASVMYTDEALSHVQKIMQEASASVQAIYDEMDKKLRAEERTVRGNQSELKAQLQDLVDTDKYLRIIEDRNKEIEKERAKKEGRVQEAKTNIYANRQTEVKVNAEYFEMMGIAVPEGEAEKEEIEEADRTVWKNSSDSKKSHKSEDKTVEERIDSNNKDENLLDVDHSEYKRVADEPDLEARAAEAQIRVDLDSDYFRWKKQQEEEKQTKTENKKAASEEIKEEVEEAADKLSKVIKEGAIHAEENLKEEDLRIINLTSESGTIEETEDKGKKDDLELSREPGDFTENIHKVWKSLTSPRRS